ncbi:DUF1542 domain-containing protein, partial [Staphylococcus aureus]|uniref:DUF1542 domain-containing protein n=1 Tax=Staphylococcus aureus TaxID=1280 RepID=UPI00210893AE
KYEENLDMLISSLSFADYEKYEEPEYKEAVKKYQQKIKKSNASLQDEKDVANDKIGKIETKAIKDIDAATTKAQVEAIKTKAINDINQTTPATTAKAAALEEFDEVVQAQIDQETGIKATHEEGILHPVEMIESMQKVLTDETTVTVDVGSHYIWMARNFRCYNPRHFLFSNGMQTLGVALP